MNTTLTETFAVTAVLAVSAVTIGGRAAAWLSDTFSTVVIPLP